MKSLGLAKKFFGFFLFMASMGVLFMASMGVALVRPRPAGLAGAAGKPAELG